MRVEEVEMTNTRASHKETGSRRHIGPIGTTARVVLGLVLLLDGVLGGNLVVNHGQVRTGFKPLGVLLGLVGFPADCSPGSGFARAVGHLGFRKPGP